MQWPVYPDTPPMLAGLPAACAAPIWQPILRHNARVMAGESDLRGGPTVYHVAVDVFRTDPPGLVWSSWPQETGQTVQDWAESQYGPDAPTSHDTGVWGVPGVQSIAQWLAPTKASTADVPGLLAVRDLLYTLVAMASGGPVERVYSLSAIRQRLSQGTPGFAVLTLKAGVYRVRCAIWASGETVASPSESLPCVRAVATAIRRDNWRGKGDATISGQPTEFFSPSAKPHILIRCAKKALGVESAPQIRQPGALYWRMTAIPYDLSVDILDSNWLPCPPASVEDSDDMPGQ